VELFVDSACVDEIRSLCDLGIIDGVTTNPSLIARTGRPIQDVISEIASCVEGAVSAEVVAESCDDMVRQGIGLASIADNVVIKLPMTWEGIKACQILSSKEYMVNMTLCFSANQALLAAKSGAFFISPFVGRVDDLTFDGTSLIQDIRDLYDVHAFETRVLAASIRTVCHVKQAALAGADCATLPPAVVQKLISHPLTNIGLQDFLSDWQSTGQTFPF